jgi:hypothetical protein
MDFDGLMDLAERGVGLAESVGGPGSVWSHRCR